jgi:hypothetical protein
MRVTLPALGLALFSPAAVVAQAPLLLDGFESASTCHWSSAFPEDAPPGVECGLGEFGPALSFLHEGSLGSPTVPEPLTAHLFRPALADTFVTVVSDDPSSLDVVGGGVLIPTGASDGVVLLDGLQQHPGVTLTAIHLAVSLPATVRVVGAGEVPVLVSFDPPSTTVEAGTAFELRVELDLPAPPGGAVVALGAVPGLGSLPPSVLVAEDQIAATFSYLAGNSPGVDLLSASYGAVVLFAEVTIVVPPPAPPR